MKLFEDHRRILFYAVALFLAANALDLISSELVQRKVPFVEEQNPYMRDASGRFSLPKATFVKGLLILIQTFPLTLVLGLAFRSYAIASLPLWYLGIDVFHAAIMNFLLLTVLL